METAQQAPALQAAAGIPAMPQPESSTHRATASASPVAPEVKVEFENALRLACRASALKPRPSHRFWGKLETSLMWLLSLVRAWVTSKSGFSSKTTVKHAIYHRFKDLHGGIAPSNLPV